jgi:YD repeat-containing protein
MTEETLPSNRVLKHTYDEAGNRTSLTTPEGEKTSYAYDAADPPAGDARGRAGHAYGGTCRVPIGSS